MAFGQVAAAVTGLPLVVDVSEHGADGSDDGGREDGHFGLGVSIVVDTFHGDALAEVRR